MAYRIIVRTVIGLLLLAVLGAVTGPQWDPVPLTDPIQVQSTSTVIGHAPAEQHYQVRTRIVTVQLDGGTVEAQISEPIGAPGRRPGVVFVHGAGTGKFTVAFLAQAHALAAAGIVAMVPNKRLENYTTRYRNYVSMAGDYLRSVDLLRTQPDVDPTKVGVYGESEGGWITPVMATEDPRLAFVVLVSAPIVPPRQQAAFATDNYLRRTGVPDGVFRAIPRAVGITPPGGGFDYVDFDVAPYLRAMHQPVLVVYGTADASMPIVQGAQKVIEDTAIAGNEDYTVRYYAGANHGLRVNGAVSPAFLRDLTDWVGGLPTTSAAWPRIAGAQPTQTYEAGPVPVPRWLSDGDVIVGTVVGSVVLIAAGAALELVSATTLRAANRTRRRRGRPPLRSQRLAPGLAAPLAAVGAGTVAAMVALVWYLVTVAKLAVSYEQDAWVVTGGWIAERVLGIAVVVAVVVLLDRMQSVRRVPGARLARGTLASLVLWLPLTGAAVLLGVLAYWGIYQLGI